eukprot:CAMPEP_0180043404 /NCGR_PEP_ID=MMETSP0984-20121128/35313_1 /TAXON_ID=483367 /ORGANISM="non described non described, Strain CCMP 2436" /LENGTH=97 /DNA_ID=CAMNT_0021971385 /DNA_START=249 /DNA_END=538 /DNA_ORIENTATION=+
MSRARAKPSALEEELERISSVPPSSSDAEIVTNVSVEISLFDSTNRPLTPAPTEPLPPPPAEPERINPGDGGGVPTVATDALTSLAQSITLPTLALA